MKNILLVIASVLLVGCSRECREEKNVASDATRPLVCVRIPIAEKSTMLSDIERELMHRIAAKMNRELVVEYVSLRDVFMRLQDGSADFSIGILNETVARKEMCLFSNPYAYGGSCFLYRANEPKACMSLMTRLKVGVLSGATSDFYLCSQRGNPIRFPSFGAMYKSFQNKEIDTIFAVDAMVKLAEKNSNGLYKTSAFEVKETYAIAIAKTRKDVLAVANEIIANEIEVKGEIK